MTRPSGARMRPYDLVGDIEDEFGTASRSVTKAKTLDATQTAAAMLTEEHDNDRMRARMRVDDSAVTHETSYLDEWRLLSQRRNTDEPTTMLEELADIGFAWRHVAEMLNVSIAAVQKWRRADPLTGINRGKLVRLMGATDFIKQHYAMKNIASWFEMPVIDLAPVTAIDLWADNENPLFFEHLTKHLRPEDIMDRFEPGWREKYRSDFEVFTAGDGELAIRPKAR